MTPTQPESSKPIVKTRSFANVSQFVDNQNNANTENATGNKRIPAGAARVLPPAAHHPRQSKVCDYNKQLHP